MSDAQQPLEPSEIRIEHFEYGVSGGGSVPGQLLIDDQLAIAIMCQPTDNYVEVFNHDYASDVSMLDMYGVKNRARHLCNIPYFENKEERARFLRLIAKALDLE